jgi:hypothetical protein
MYLVRGQKDGAWHCPKCKAEFWDKVERRGKLSKKDVKALEVAPRAVQQIIPCPRCITISMIILLDDSYYCPQCSMRFYPEGAPELDKIVDQKIKCGTQNLLYHWDNIQAKHKSNGSHKSKQHGAQKVTTPFECRYNLYNCGNGAGKKGA